MYVWSPKFVIIYQLIASHIIKVIANKRWFIASIKLTKY